MSLSTTRAISSVGGPLSRVSWNRVLTAAVFAITLMLMVPFVADYGLSFVHLHRFENHLGMLVTKSLAPERADVIKIFQDFGGEYRPRSLNYAIVLLDLKLRLAFYSLGVLHPTFSLAWIGLGLSAFLIYQLACSCTQDRSVALLTTCIFVTNTGFLSAITMSFMPGKPLSIVAIVLALWTMSRLSLGARAGELLHQTAGRAKYSLWAIMFLGFLLDEVPLFIIPVLPVLFLELFIGGKRHRRGWSDIARTVGFYLVPFCAFLMFALIVVPIITRRYYGFTFDYLSTLIGFGGGAAGAKSLFEGPYGGFSLGTLFTNFVTLFGLSLVPWPLSNLVGNPGTGGVLSSEAIRWPSLTILAFLLTAICWLAARTTGQRGRYFRRLLVVAILSVLFESLLNARHVPYISGYYYGSAFSAFLSLLLAFSLAEVNRLHRRLAASALIALGVVVIQIVNFYPLNDSWIYLHNEVMDRPRHMKTINLSADERRVTAAELSSIWRAWRLGHLNEYVEAHPISTGAIFMVVELRWLDHLRKQRTRRAG
jgi:hypothetical protein